MPRLNYGTLLENIVLLEVARYVLEELPEESALGFATSFAMPPLTQCWCKQGEGPNNPYFAHEFLLKFVGVQNDHRTLQSFWALCLENRPKLGIRPFHQKAERFLYDYGGPNGALLASMLALQSGRSISLWVNDNEERYAESLSTAESSESGLDELLSAAKLLEVEPRGKLQRVVGSFPDTISNLASWIGDGDGARTTFRIGFLDPDNYAEGEAQVSSLAHSAWLRTLAVDATNVVSVTFSGCQNRGTANTRRNQRLALFHSDEVALYPRSLLFEYGNFQTGVKILWPVSSIQLATESLRARIVKTWGEWHPLIGPLTVHENGDAAD